MELFRKILFFIVDKFNLMGVITAIVDIYIGYLSIKTSKTNEKDAKKYKRIFITVSFIFIIILQFVEQETGIISGNPPSVEESGVTEEAEAPGHEATGEPGPGETEESGSEETPDTSPPTLSPTDDTRGVVRILNKKSDMGKEFERLVSRFKEETKTEISVVTPESGKYASALKNATDGNKTTLFMMGGLTDFEKYGDVCLDLTDCAAAKELEDWAKVLTGSNGKIYGLPFIVESYGLAVNLHLLKKAGYVLEDIQSFEDLKSIAEDISFRKDQLGFTAFTSPSIGSANKGFFRFSEHAPAVPLYYELKDNDFNVRMKLQGTYMNNFREFIDLYLNNATVSRKAATSRSLRDAQQEFLREEAVFHLDGSWNMDDIKAVMDDQAAVIPLYMGMPGESKQGLCRTFSYYWCINRKASHDDIEATKRFLEWLVTTEIGINFMTKEMGFQQPYKKADIPENIFLQTLQDEREAGLIIIDQYYKYGEDTKWRD